MSETYLPRNPQNANSPNGTLVYNNTLSNSNIGGVYLGAGINPVSNVKIDSNQFLNMTTPIRVEGSSNNIQVINTTIQNNTFSSSTYGMRAGCHGGHGYADMLNIISNWFISIGSYPAIVIESGPTQVTIPATRFLHAQLTYRITLVKHQSTATSGNSNVRFVQRQKTARNQISERLLRITWSLLRTKYTLISVLKICIRLKRRGSISYVTITFLMCPYEATKQRRCAEKMKNREQKRFFLEC